MTEGSESDYFVRREQEERACAARSSDPAARRAHLELAEHYSVRALTSGANEGK